MVCVCLCVFVLSCWVGWGHPLFRPRRYHLPNLRLTLINLWLCNSNLRRQFFLTSEACTVATDVVFPVWSALWRLCEMFFPHYLSQISKPLRLVFLLFFPPKQNNLSPARTPHDKHFNKLVIFGWFYFYFLLFVLSGIDCTPLDILNWIMTNALFGYLFTFISVTFICQN